MPSLPSRRAAIGGLLVALLAAGCTTTGVAQAPIASAPPLRTSLAQVRSDVAWPEHGQASYAFGRSIVSSPRQRPVPIASLAKVMTAYVAVQHLSPSAHVRVDASDVADTRRRIGRGESVVAVARGEVLDRHQALTALLLPSANNVTAMLAEHIAGSRSEFVFLMNRTAQQLGMTDTTYTDPSGYAPSTTSTAHDQLLLLKAALRFPELRRVMGTTSAVLPVAGRVRNTNTLLGQDGFVAGKTGSTSAAGGCLAFRIIRGDRVMDGVVLGQRGRPLIEAGLRAASDLAAQAFAA